MNDENINKDLMQINSNIVETIAEFVHDIWAKWMKYQFSKCTRIKTTDLTAETKSVNLLDETGDLLIPKELVERWARQLNTPYAELPDNEKNSDRQIAMEYIDKILNLLVKHIQDDNLIQPS